MDTKVTIFEFMKQTLQKHMREDYERIDNCESIEELAFATYSIAKLSVTRFSSLIKFADDKELVLRLCDELDETYENEKAQ